MDFPRGCYPSYDYCKRRYCIAFGFRGHLPEKSPRMKHLWAFFALSREDAQSGKPDYLNRNCPIQEAFFQASISFAFRTKPRNYEPDERRLGVDARVL